MRLVPSLDPGALDSKDLVDLSGRGRPRILFKHHPKTFDICYGTEGRRFVVFPSGTRGFFYFHRSHKHAAAAEIRFRIIRPEDVHSPATEAFAQGSDLVSPDGISTWRLPVLRAFKYPAVRDQLVGEGLISKPQAAQINAILASSSWHLSLLLENITDPFIWNMKAPTITILILQQEGFFHGVLHLYLANPRHLAYKHRLLLGSKSGNDFASIYPHNWQY